MELLERTTQISSGNVDTLNVEDFSLPHSWQHFSQGRPYLGENKGLPPFKHQSPEMTYIEYITTQDEVANTKSSRTATNHSNVH